MYRLQGEYAGKGTLIHVFYILVSSLLMSLSAEASSTAVLQLERATESASGSRNICASALAIHGQRHDVRTEFRQKEFSSGETCQLVLETMDKSQQILTELNVRGTSAVTEAVAPGDIGMPAAALGAAAAVAERGQGIEAAKRKFAAESLFELHSTVRFSSHVRNQLLRKRASLNMERLGLQSRLQNFDSEDPTIHKNIGVLRQHINELGLATQGLKAAEESARPILQRLQAEVKLLGISAADLQSLAAENGVAQQELQDLALLGEDADETVMLNRDGATGEDSGDGVAGSESDRENNGEEGDAIADADSNSESDTDTSTNTDVDALSGEDGLNDRMNPNDIDLEEGNDFMDFLKGDKGKSLLLGAGALGGAGLLYAALKDDKKSGSSGSAGSGTDGDEFNGADGGSSGGSNKSYGQELAISPSGHYFTYKGKAVMLLGDSGTQVVPQNANVNYREWVDAAAARGVSALHVWALLPPRQKRDGSKIEQRYGYVYKGLTPWARKGNSGGADQMGQWDLHKFDDAVYWKRMRDLASYSASKGIVLGITMFFGWTKTGEDFAYHPFHAQNGGHLTDNNQVGIIASPGKEILNQKFDPNWSPQMKTQYFWEKYSEKMIAETGGFGNTFYVYMDERSYPAGNMAGHFAQFFRKRGKLWADTRSVGGANIVTEHIGNPSQAFAGAKPYIELEDPPYSGDGLRRKIWQHAVLGAHYIQHNDERQENEKTGVMVFDPNVKGGNKAAVLNRITWQGAASKMFNQLVKDLDSMAPRGGVAQGAQCLANPGVEYACYAERGGTITLNLGGAKGTFTATWLDPRTGATRPAGTASGGSAKAFSSPGGGDWALYVGGGSGSGSGSGSAGGGNTSPSPGSGGGSPVTNLPSLAGNGILWKPVSEGDGRLVVLLSASMAEQTVSVLDASGNVIDTGRFAGRTNGNRPTYRFSRPGSGYGTNAILQVGSRRFAVNGTSNRHEP